MKSPTRRLFRVCWQVENLSNNWPSRMLNAISFPNPTDRTAHWVKHRFNLCRVYSMNRIFSAKNIGCTIPNRRPPNHTEDPGRLDPPSGVIRQAQSYPIRFSAGKGTALCGLLGEDLTHSRGDMSCWFWLLAVVDQIGVEPTFSAVRGQRFPIKSSGPSIFLQAEEIAS